MKRIIDSHCHIYPEKIAEKAVASIDQFYGGLPVGHLDGTVETLLKTGKKAGISHFVVHSVATTPAQTASINQFIARSVSAADGAFTGLGALHPDSENLRGDFEHILSLGLKGIKIHPDFQRFEADCAKAFRIYELCEEYELPVLVHTGDYRYDYSNPERIAAVLRSFPKLKFVGAHFGGWSVWDRAQSLLPDFPNIMVDASSSFPWMKPEQAREMIHAFGAQRVMFGTDYPMWTQQPDIRFLEKLGLEPEEEEQIFWKNCASLYQLKGYCSPPSGCE